MPAYLRPTTLTEALAHLSDHPARILAGGTDIYPATQAAMLAGPILDLTALPELRSISQNGSGLRIGACTSWAEIARADLAPALWALQQAAREVGGRQIQNAGTIGGNLCNASPAADGVPPLLVVDASVELLSASGIRTMLLSDFLQGPRQTLLAPDEILTAVTIPNDALKGQSHFLKLGARAYLVISIAMVAVRLTTEEGRITSAALAVGACSATARRIPKAEAILLGQSLEHAPSAIDDTMIAEALAPLNDLRATAAYRSESAAVLLRRALSETCRGLS